MKYINISDIRDGLLDVKEEDIAVAEEYLEDVAERKGIKSKDIVVPLSFKAKRLAVDFACYNCCLGNVGTDPTTTFDGGTRDDIYAQKLSLYKKEIKEIEETITAFDFAGVKLGGLTIGLERA